MRGSGPRLESCREVSTVELSALKEPGTRLLGLSGRELRISVDDGALEEICRDC
jgi:hypothetical protein